MAYSFACASLGADCPGSFTTTSKDELLEHVSLHARAEHPELTANPDAGAMLEKAIVAV